MSTPDINAQVDNTFEVIKYGGIIQYPIPPYKQEAYPELNNLSFPITEKNT